MGRIAAGLLLALTLVPAAASGGQDQPQHRRKWWQDDKVRAELALTPDQAAGVESIFQDALPKLKATKKQLDELEAELSRTIRERTASEDTISGQIDRVEAKRAELSKARTLMLYRMHLVLTPEQNGKLQGMHERWQKERGRESRRP